jgi:hypothetical protein
MQGLGLKPSVGILLPFFLVKRVTLTFEGLDAEGARLHLVIIENVATDLAKPGPRC